MYLYVSVCNGQIYRSVIGWCGSWRLYCCFLLVRISSLSKPLLRPGWRLVLLYKWSLPDWPKKKFQDGRCQRGGCTHFAWLSHVAVFINSVLHCTTDHYLPCLRRCSKISSCVVAIVSVKKGGAHILLDPIMKLYTGYTVQYILYILAPAWPQQRFGEWAYSDQ
jgi:hypothetical protein